MSDTATPEESEQLKQLLESMDLRQIIWSQFGHMGAAMCFADLCHRVLPDNPLAVARALLAENRRKAEEELDKAFSNDELPQMAAMAQQYSVRVREELDSLEETILTVVSTYPFTAAKVTALREMSAKEAATQTPTS